MNQLQQAWAERDVEQAVQWSKRTALKRCKRCLVYVQCAPDEEIAATTHRCLEDRVRDLEARKEREANNPPQDAAEEDGTMATGTMDRPVTSVPKPTKGKKVAKAAATPKTKAAKATPKSDGPVERTELKTAAGKVVTITRAQVEKVAASEEPTSVTSWSVTVNGRRWGPRGLVAKVVGEEVKSAQAFPALERLGFTLRQKEA